MKALLMKDYLILVRNCKQLLIVPLIFVVVALLTKELFLAMWPVFFISLMPYTISSYEEQSGWPLYAETMPFDRKMIVCEKYVLMLINGAIVTGIMGLIAIVVLRNRGELTLTFLSNYLMLIAGGSLLPGSIMMPMLFKYGSTKGRTMYLVVLSVFAGLMGMLGSMSKESTFTEIINHMDFHIGIIVIVIALLYIGSAALSVNFYEKRDL